MKHHILLLLFNYSFVFSTTINNDLTIKNLSINAALEGNSNNTLNNVFCNGNTISFNSKCFLNKITLEGLEQKLSFQDVDYYLMLNNSRIVGKYIFLDQNLLSIDTINSFYNNININTAQDTGNILFLNNVNVNGLITLTASINALDQKIILNQCSLENITITGSNSTKNASFNIAPLCDVTIYSNIININDINNDGNLELINQNSAYDNVGKIILLNPTKSIFTPEALFINNNNNTISKNTINSLSYQGNSICNLYSNNNLTIKNNQKIILQNNYINIKKMMINDGIHWNNLTLNAPEEVYLDFLISNMLRTNLFKTFSTELYILNQDIILFDNITGIDIAGDALFTINAKNIFYDRGAEPYLSILQWNAKLGSGSPLVLDENDQLFTIPASSKRFMENIAPLNISPSEFEAAFDCIDNNSESIEVDKWVGTALEPMIRYDKNGKPLMYEERDLLAVCYTQLPYLKTQIESLKNEINIIKEYLDLDNVN